MRIMQLGAEPAVPPLPEPCGIHSARPGAIVTLRNLLEGFEVFEFHGWAAIRVVATDDGAVEPIGHGPVFDAIKRLRTAVNEAHDEFSLFEVKQTGNGHREAGTTALDIFTEWKSVYVDYSGRLQRAQIDTDAS